MSVKLMTMTYEAHFWDIAFQRVIKKKSGEEKQAQIKILAHTAKAVLLALADHANEEGEGAYPGLSTLESKTELSRNSVIATLEALKIDGIIFYVGLSKYGTCNYTISKQKLLEMADRPRQERKKLVKPLPVASEATSLPLVKPLPVASEATSPEPPINRHDEPSIEPSIALDSANPPNIPASFGLEWQIGAGVDKVVIPENDTTRDKASWWAAIIAMNNADLEPLALEFMTSANKLPTDSDIKYWRKVFRKFRNYSARPASADDIRRAVVKHIAARLPIKSPASIEWALIEIISPTPEANAASIDDNFMEELEARRARLLAEKQAV